MAQGYCSAYQLPLEKVYCCTLEKKEAEEESAAPADTRHLREALEKSQAQVRAQLAEIEAIYNSAAVGLGILDRDLRFIRVNQRLAEINGVPVEEHIGRKLNEIIPSFAAQEENIFKAVVRTGEPVLNVERSGTTKADSGCEHHWIEQWLPVKNGAGEVIAVNVVVEDVTALKRAQAELTAADRRKDEFLSILAHELRNPLASISAGLNLLCHPRTTEEKAAFVKETLRQRVQQLARLIDDLLDISRIARGKVSLNKERIAISIIIERAVEVVRETMEERNHSLSLSAEESLFVYADPSRIEQVLVNMLVNAAKYTGEGGKIRIVAAREGDMAVVSVKDNGVGIRSEMLSRIFELFQQEDKSLHRGSGGLGIGLPLIRKLAEMHEGTVEASSEGPGRGSEFRLRLPLIESPFGEKKVINGVSVCPTGLRILVVEDHYDTAIMTAAVLQTYGHSVEIAHDGVTGLKMTLEMKPDVVILDIGLPGLDGYEVARGIRKEIGEATLIVAATGYGQEGDIRKCRESGINFHFLKPIDYETLVPMLMKQSQREGQGARTAANA